VDLGQIEAFVQVANHRSFSKAADALYLTQPSVSARIQGLERDLGEQLFERDGRGVRLTEVGTCFLPYARRVLKTIQDGRDALEGVRSLEMGALRVGSVVTVGTYVLPGILKEFCARYPRLEVSVRTGPSDQVIQMVLADEVQLALARTVAHPDVEAVPLYEDEVVLVTAPQHPLAATGRAEIEDLSREPLIIFSRGSGYYALVQGALREAGVVPRTAMEMDSMEATKKMVEEGLGIAMLPRVSAERELEQGILVEIKVKGMTMPKREISLVYRRNRRLSRAALAFFELLGERYEVNLPTLTTGVK
jgi:DNA-binding transcriptional LysR family regulator